MHPNTFIEQLWSGEELDEVFVAMSFDARFDSRFESIFKPAIEEIPVDGRKLRANRVNENKSGDSIITDIVRGIAQSCVVLADLSAIQESSAGADTVFRNGNVMYELGLAHAVKSPARVVIVRDDDKKLLFDISSIPHTTIDFSAEDEARKIIRDLIADRMDELERVIDIKLRNFLDAMCPQELDVLEQLAKCPNGSAVNLQLKLPVVGCCPTQNGLDSLGCGQLQQFVHTTSLTLLRHCIRLHLAVAAYARCSKSTCRRMIAHTRKLEISIH